MACQEKTPPLRSTLTQPQALRTLFPALQASGKSQGRPAVQQITLKQCV